MTVQELRDLLAAAERVSGLPWTLTEGGGVICGDGDYLDRMDGDVAHPQRIDAALERLEAT